MISTGSSEFKEQKPHRHRPIENTIKRRLSKCDGVKNKEFQSQFQLDNQTQLLSALEKELQEVQNDLKEAKQIIKEKDLYIYKLEKDATAKSEKKYFRTSSIQEKWNFDFSEEFYKLQFKVLNLERMLLDYCTLQDIEDIKTEEYVANEDQIDVNYRPDLDSIIEIIQDMNLNNSEPQIIHTGKGAKLQICDVIELTFYSNGIISGTTPFRPYSHKTVQVYFRDIQDGFYPTEFQEKNPEGVIFKVFDKREEEYKPAKTSDMFGSVGMKLGKASLKPQSHCNMQKESSISEELWLPLLSVVNNNNTITENQSSHHEGGMSKGLTKPKIKDGVIVDFNNDTLQDLKKVRMARQTIQPIVLNKSTKRRNEIKLKIKGFEGKPEYIVYLSTEDMIHKLHSLLPMDGAYTLAYRNNENKVQYLLSDQKTFKSYGISQSCVLFAVKN